MIKIYFHSFRSILNDIVALQIWLSHVIDKHISLIKYHARLVTVIDASEKIWRLVGNHLLILFYPPLTTREH